MPRSAVSVIPRALDNEDGDERVMVIAPIAPCGASRHGACDRRKLSISLDLEIDGELSWPPPTTSRIDLEAAIRDSSVDCRGRNSHRAAADDGPRRAGCHAAQVAAIHDALTELAVRAGCCGNVHDVRVRETPNGEIVNFHCNVDPASTVAAATTKSTKWSGGLRRRFPAIKRVIGHAEPRGRVGKANGSGLGRPMIGSACPPWRSPVGTARTKVGLARLWHIQSLSKSATADFDERAFSHPTRTTPLPPAAFRRADRQARRRPRERITHDLRLEPALGAMPGTRRRRRGSVPTETTWRSSHRIA